MKILSGREEIILTTQTELLLVAALKASLCKYGEEGGLVAVSKEFRLDRFAFTDAANHLSGDLQICMDGNNGDDLIRLLK